MNPTVTRGLELFDAGWSCAEAVTVAATERLGTTNDLVPRIATGFGGGLSRTKSLCGALAGGVLAIGVANGRDRVGDDRTVLVGKVQTLVNGFVSKFGSDNCFALTGLDFNTPTGMAVYKERVHAQCRTYVEHVLLELDRLLQT
jgi:C_GCAxxG_C_C family probable redox protein